MILVVVESISSNRIGKEQRRILKEEERKMDLSMITTVSDSTLVGGAGLSSLRKGKKHGNNASRDSELNNDNSSINSGTDNTSVTTVEIVRPEPLDPAAVIYSQQVLYDLAQRQYRQQYEQYTLQQQQSQSRGNGSSNGDTHLEEGKYDDILLESSYKFEVPMDEPLSNDSTDPSALPLSTSPSGEKLHLPSAPPAPAHPSSHSTYPIPSKAPVSLTTTSYPSSSSATNPQKQQQQRMSLLKSDISPVGIQIMTETNPYRDEDYRSLAELSASAPPYEPSSPSLSFQGVVMMPVPSSSLSQVVTSVPETLSYDNVHIDSSKTIPPTTTVETTSTTVTSGVKHDHA
ncbi:hypothetical protein EC991_009611 [Linnemannia zychae]|nr:hypothetical protein EC991_009611 [Linnemannia zychae]